MRQQSQTRWPSDSKPWQYTDLHNTNYCDELPMPMIFIDSHILQVSSAGGNLWSAIGRTYSACDITAQYLLSARKHWVFFLIIIPTSGQRAFAQSQHYIYLPVCVLSTSDYARTSMKDVLCPRSSPSTSMNTEIKNGFFASRLYLIYGLFTQ
jgi:hypothetical protein